MRIILMGGPGAGKGTQAQLLANALGIVQVSTGDILRREIAAGTVIGRRVRERMAAGGLVDDETVASLVDARLQAGDSAAGFVLDGYPRTLTQAEALMATGVGIEKVVEIVLAAELVLMRMGGRRVHPGSGRTYHVEFNPPRVEDVDDVTGEPLVTRPDDTPQTIRARIGVFEREMQPLRCYYMKSLHGGPPFTQVDGDGSVSEVFSRIEAALS